VYGGGRFLKSGNKKRIIFYWFFIHKLYFYVALKILIGLENILKIDLKSGSWIMLDGPLMELFEIYSIIPTIFKSRYFVSFSKLDFLWRYSYRCFHYFQMIRLHKNCKCISSHLFTSYLFISNDTMRSSFKITTCMNLSRLSKLEC
jgi:hypothetical protein